MRIQSAIATVTLGIAGLATCTTVTAQIGTTGANTIPSAHDTRPTVSPYLHLTNQGPGADNSFRFNGVYQTMVRPQVELRQQQVLQQHELQRLQSDLTRFQKQLAPGSTGMQRTGQGARFMNFSRYFPQPNP